MCRQLDADVAQTGVDISQGREILPTNVWATHYDLTLEPNFADFTYDGKVVIE